MKGSLSSPLALAIIRGRGETQTQRSLKPPRCQRRLRVLAPSSALILHRSRLSVVFHHRASSALPPSGDSAPIRASWLLCFRPCVPRSPLPSFCVASRDRRPGLAPREDSLGNVPSGSEVDQGSFRESGQCRRSVHEVPRAKRGQMPYFNGAACWIGMQSLAVFRSTHISDTTLSCNKVSILST
jgi:hypothetical protein